ncbi:DNA polymerase I [Caldicoprobacter faecalis]|uniref:DNA polymerase I n=1 Tax=Caldicoprobacter faecalis TaxID=937334 RepID=A0A1I5UJY4_9FIRM|nr:DNA polymerase I [Caldicoprobacter faecalis]SFP95550.1 DNA polymerase I [Caldicoprobacter faecalis]
MGRPRVMIIDGNSLMHRAFYALPMLTNKKGVPTNAVYGFTNMLLRLIEDYKPDYLGVAFDKKGPTFRHEAYTEYKATRQKTPEELIPQFDLLKRMLQLMGIAIYEVEGYEADDILGTFARLARERGWEAYLVTGDRDALQLVSPEVRVIMTKKGISDVRVFDVEGIKNEYGLTPAQIIDLKALMGDSSDNIPGVPGIGEKTALKLLHQYHTVEQVLDNADKISGQKLKEALIKYREQAMLSKRLATIMQDAPVDIKLEDRCYEIPHSRELLEFLEELEFHSIIKKLGIQPESRVSVKTSVREKNVIEVNTGEELRQQVENLIKSSRLAILVTDGCVTIADNPGRVYRIKVKNDLLSQGLNLQDIFIELKPILERQEVRKIVHDGKRLILEAHRCGIHVEGLEFDVFIAAYLLDPAKNRYDLSQLLYEYADLDVDDADAADLYLLADHMRDKLKETEMLYLYEEIEHPLINVLADMEITGFKVDKRMLEQLGEEFSAELSSLTREIYALAGEEFNINSPRQLGSVLFEKLGLPVIKKSKTGYSTDIEVLEQLRPYHELVEKIIEYRQVMKLKSTYIDGLLSVIDPGDGRIHSSFNQTVTATGRISSAEPNLQNIPVKLEMGRRIRKVFVASGEDYVLVDADYSQIELRVLAHMSGDPTFIDAFRNNQDIHLRTASEIFGVPIDKVTPEQRSSAKAVNFGIVYGISDYGLAKSLGISRKQAREYIDSYFARYPKVKEYMERIVEIAKKQGYVTTLMNRRRYLPELKSRNFNIRSQGERLAMNTPIQGSAADIIKKAMNDVYAELKRRNLKSKLILQVHDELIIDTYRPELEEVKDLVVRCMENAVKLSVPLVVDVGVGRSWYDAK